jgi:hypothetical protein
MRMKNSMIMVLTVCNTLVTAIDELIDAVDVGTPELTSPASFAPDEADPVGQSACRVSARAGHR